MKADDYRERKLEIEGWPVNLTSYRIGETFYCNADNVSPGATLVRVSAPTREEAEAAAIERAKVKLASTQRHAV
ncbi:MAG TPA: hypothetical protein VH639_17345 [Bryobacteraceae bacterium]|jgi:hypothetical protein